MHADWEPIQYNTISHINRNFSVKVNKLTINTSIDRVVEHKYVGSNTDNHLIALPYKIYCPRRVLTLRPKPEEAL